MAAEKYLKIIDHPVLQSHMSVIRNKNTGKQQFKHSLDIISHILAVEVLSELNLREVKVPTPFKTIKGKVVGEKVILLPILRAGLGLLEGFHYFVPEAPVAHAGLFRNEETLEPVPYYFRFPKLRKKDEAMVIILDPMVATGGSAVFVIRKLLNMGIGKIRLASVISAPEGIERIIKAIPKKDLRKFEIITCGLDERLNDKGYILPGLGDAGDRLFGT